LVCLLTVCEGMATVDVKEHVELEDFLQEPRDDVQVIDA
jgi:hypothetical protein